MVAPEVSSCNSKPETSSGKTGEVSQQDEELNVRKAMELYGFIA